MKLFKTLRINNQSATQWSAYPRQGRRLLLSRSITCSVSRLWLSLTYKRSVAAYRADPV